MKRIKKLTNYFMASVGVSILVMLMFWNILLRIIGMDYISERVNHFMQNQETGVLLIIGVLYFSVLILIFLISLYLLLRPKTWYIRYLTKGIKEMKKDGFGEVLTVEGRDELAELCQNINEMSVALKEKKDAQEREEEKKNRLIADISHDIRTPLTSIIGYVNLIVEDDYQNKEKCREYMEVVERRLGNLKEMTESLFDYTKLIQKDYALEKRTINLLKLAGEVVQEYRYLYKKKGLSLQTKFPEKPIWIDIDYSQYARALANLLDNAGKYSVLGSEVIFEISQRDSQIMLSISNETNSIEKEELDNLFERFYRGDKARTGANSTGLGLPIVKQIINLHHGEIGTRMENDRIYFEIVHDF